MDEKAGLIISLLDRAIEFAKTGLELLKLKTAERVSGFLSSLITRIVVILIVFMVILMGSVGLALWLGDVLGKPWYGFLVIAGFYSLFGIIFAFVFKKWVKRRINDQIVNKLFK